MNQHSQINNFKKIDETVNKINIFFSLHPPKITQAGNCNNLQSLGRE